MAAQYKPYLKRLGITFLLALGFVVVFNEITYWIQKDQSDRPPQDIVIVIPSGTAEKVANGEDEPSLPSEMTFVVGDKLIVKNEDNVDHQLGPLWIPAGRTASLNLEQAANYAYQCSFAVGNYFGLNVKKPTTIMTRVLAMGLAAPTMTMFFFIYSLLAVPIRPDYHQKPKVRQAEEH